MSRTSTNSARDRKRSISRSGSGRDVALPLIDGEPGSSKPIRASKNAPRRAIVLAVIQLLIIAHVLQWWITGTTVSPIEPAEAMEFVRRGTINAGLIFFASVLVSTVVLGRWMCGWGCHVVMLQDLCKWIMGKLGIRPKPFRSRLLMFVPLALGLYMFVWPVFYWLAIAPWTSGGVRWPGFNVALTTSDFWQTFPGWLLAIPFLLICGFATVYFMGAKGFCTYACPYGGLFRPLDELSPARIRVNESCEQSGHCTSVCSSNVRVHDEVREFGMVVDPGCMKCLDCVSVCPNEALHFGFGRPAVMKGTPRNAVPKKHYDLTLPEEIAFGLVFMIAFLAFRGDVVRFPLLMTAGLASVLTFLGWKLWRMIALENVRLHGFQFKRRGKATRTGNIYGALVLMLGVMVVHSALVNLIFLNADRLDQRVTVPLDDVYGATPPELSDDMTRDASRAIAWYRASTTFSDGGISIVTNPRAQVRMAWLHSCLGDYESAQRLMMLALEIGPPNRRHHLDAALIYEKLGRTEEADRHRALARNLAPSSGTMRE